MSLATPSDVLELADLDLDGPEFCHNPYPTLKRLLEQDRPVWCPHHQGFYIAHHEAVSQLLSDPRISSSRTESAFALLSQEDQHALTPLRESMDRWILLMDVPRHTRIRSIIAKNFNAVSRMITEERIESLVHGLIDGVARKGQMDLVADLAYPLPATVIMDLLDVPYEDGEKLKEWSKLFGLAFLVDPEMLKLAQNAMVEMGNYFRELLAERRKKPGTDLISRMISAEKQGDRLDDEEIIANCNLMMFAGHETTTNLIANGVLSLLQHPEELARLKQQPQLIDSAVEEFLRFESPVPRLSRTALETLTVQGQTIPKGSRVYLSISAANRDGSRFKDPDRFDVGRGDKNHLGFGAGTHFCVGATLARLECRVALRVILSRLEDLAIADPGPKWLPYASLRGLERLPVSFKPMNPST